jgi:hypothetical protein
MHDGAPPRFLGIARHHLNRTFGEQWIGRGDPDNWPARPPDRNPLSFWPGGPVNVLVYSAPISD